MAVFLDGIPAIPEKENDDATVQMCFETIFAYCYKRNKAIDRMIIDGNSVSLEEFSKYYNLFLKDIERLEFLTIDQAGLFSKLITLGKKFVEVAEELENISTLINAGKDADALMIVRNVSVMTHELLISHRFFALFSLPLQYPVGDSNILEYKDKINPLLSKLLDAFQAKDTVEFSDLAE